MSTATSSLSELDRAASQIAIQGERYPESNQRMRDMLEYNGQVIYRSYSFNADGDQREYTVHQERPI